MDSIETPEALSAADPPPVMAAVPCPEAEAVPSPSDAPPLTIPLEPSTLPASVVFSPTSASASISPTQPQSQVPQQQRQTIAARTRSQNNHGQPSVSSPSSIPCSTSSSSSYPSIQRSGVAIGVPALHPHHNRPPSQAGYTIGSSSQFSQPFLGSSSPSQSFSQPFGGFPRGSVSLAEQSSSSTVSSSSFSQPFSAMSRSCAGKPEQQSISNSQFKPPVPGVQTIGMIGSLSSASRLPAGGIQPQQRLGQPIEKSIPQSGINQALNLQKFPNLGLSRPASMPSPNIPMPALQNAQSLQQQWMPNQAKQTHGTSFPSSSYRPQSKQHNSQQRPQSPQKQQQQHSPTVTPNQLQVSSSQKQEQQYHQQQQQQQKQLQQHQLQQHLQATRGASIPQRSNNQLGQPVLPHPGVTIPITEVTAETSNRILSKRSIQDLVAQIDPYEKLEPEVEDVLVEIADDFIESITTAACLLAKHRRSTTLEAKDILLHVERNWNFTLPGFGGDEVKLYKKPYTSDIHKERLAMIRKSMGITNDVGSTKNVGNAQVSINSKAHSNRASTAASASPKGM